MIGRRSALGTGEGAGGGGLGGRGGFAEDEEFDEGADQKGHGELAQKEALGEGEAEAIVRLESWREFSGKDVRGLLLWSLRRYSFTRLVVDRCWNWLAHAEDYSCHRVSRGHVRCLAMACSRDVLHQRERSSVKVAEA